MRASIFFLVVISEEGKDTEIDLNSWSYYDFLSFDWGIEKGRRYS